MLNYHLNYFNNSVSQIITHREQFICNKPTNSVSIFRTDFQNMINKQDFFCPSNFGKVYIFGIKICGYKNRILNFQFWNLD